MSWLASLCTWQLMFLEVLVNKTRRPYCPHFKFKTLEQWWDYREGLWVASWAKFKFALKGTFFPEQIQPAEHIIGDQVGYWNYNVFTWYWELVQTEWAHFKVHLLMIPGYIPWFILGVVLVIALVVWIWSTKDEIL